MEPGSRYRSSAPLTYWVTRKGTYHWSLDCSGLRRAKISTLLSTEVPPTDPYLLCLDCFHHAGAPSGFASARDLSDEELLRRMRKPLPGGTNHGNVPTAESHNNDRSRMTETLEDYRIALILTSPCGTIQDADSLARQMMDLLDENFDNLTFETHGLESLNEEQAELDLQNPGDLAFEVRVEAEGLFFAHDAEYVQKRVEGMMIENNLGEHTVTVRRRA